MDSGRLLRRILKMAKIWEDGVCNLCGSKVEEGPSDNNEFDYMNRCINVECVEHKWHYCGDIEFLDYYTHILTRSN
jgi:hypothetical protein